MAGEWVDKAVGDIADVVGGSTPSTRDPANFDGDVPWLTPKDLSSPHSRYVKRGERNLSSKGFESCSAQLLPANSVLLSSRAPIGYLAIAANPIATNQGFRSLIVRPAYDHEFLYYWLSGNIEELERHSSGSTFKELSGTALKQIRLRLPVDRDEQRVIARILGTLDNKIELNRRMNATLEAMARALFQSWFVDFDPVRAKLDGRPPAALDPATAALFPEHLQDSPLGHIPKGWEIKPFGELADVNWGDTNTTKKSYVPEGFTAYSAAGPDGLLPYHDYDRTGVVVSAIGSAGLSWLALGKWSCIKNTIRFWATALGISTEYLYQATKGQERWPIRGSVQPFISQGDARAMRILAPANGLAERFGEVVRPWLAKIEANKAESRTLATLRDTLLPKLLSGELSVAEATGNRDFQVQPGMPKP